MRSPRGGELARRGLYHPAREHDACGVGFVAHIKGRKAHDIVEQGLKILENLDHRGAVGAGRLMGDGAGILIQIPDDFYRAEMAAQGVTLPPPGEYGVGMIFLHARERLASGLRTGTRAHRARGRPGRTRLARRTGRPFDADGAAPLQAQGLYDPAREHDACGVGFVAHIKGQRAHGILEQGLKILEKRSGR